MLLVFFESSVKSLELKSGSGVGFTKNLSSVDSSHFLEHQSLNEVPYQKPNRKPETSSGTWCV